MRKDKKLFLEEVWQQVEPIYKKMKEHPFVVELAKGVLPIACFTHYLQQDMLYLRIDAEVFNLLADRWEKENSNVEEREERARFFRDMATDNIATELWMEKQFLKEFSITKATELGPAIKNYTTFLQQQVQTNTIAVATAALLPCFWLYALLTREILKIAVQPNPYQLWIDTYQGEEYLTYTDTFLTTVESLAKKATSTQKGEMKQAIVRAAQLELAFLEESITICHS
ncbi:MAG: TenA family protein [Bacteroidaceae bacterium]|nr:TenA family protein [Bacteroidaceae bacterium]